MPYEDTLITKFIADTSHFKRGLQEVTKLVRESRASINRMVAPAQQGFQKISAGAQQATKSLRETAGVTEQLEAQMRQLETYTGRATTSFRRAAISVQTGIPLFDNLSLAIDRASMMMWRFTIAAIPFRQIAFQATALATAFGFLGTKMATTASKYEIARRQFIALFESMGKGREEAQQMLDWLIAQDPKLVATVDEIIEAGRLLISTGYDVKEVLYPLADLQVGLNQAGIGLVEATRAFIDAMHGEFRRLRNTFNISRQDVEKYAQDAIDAQGRIVDKMAVQQAIILAIQEKYPQANRVAMGTLIQQWTNFATELYKLMRAIGDYMREPLIKGLRILTSFAEGLRKLVETPWIGKIAAWSIILTTVGAGFTALAAYIGYVGMQLAGLAASFATFFHMRNKENAQLLEAENKAKTMSERLAQVRAKMLLAELPLQEARLQLLIAQSEQEAALLKLSQARARGVGVEAAEAAYQAAAKQTAHYQKLADQMAEISQLGAMEMRIDELRALNLDERIKANKGIIRFYQNIAKEIPKELDAADQLNARLKSIEQHYQMRLAQKKELESLERKVREVRKYDINQIERELGIKQQEISRTERLLALEKERLRTLRAAVGLVQPTLAPTMLRGVPAGWGQIGRVSLTGTAAQLASATRREMMLEAWRQIGSTLIAPLRVAQGAIVGFTGALKRGALALWAGLRPMLSSIATGVMQMGVWAAAFASLAFVAKLAARNIDKFDKELSRGIEEIGKSIEFLRSQNLIPIPQWQLEATERARAAAMGYQRFITGTRTVAGFPTQPRIAVREMLARGGLPEAEAEDIRRRARLEIQIYQDYLKKLSPAERILGIREARLRSSIRELQRLVDSQDILNEKIHTSVALELARVLATEKTSYAKKLERDPSEKIVDLDERAKELAERGVALSKEQAEVIKKAEHPAQALADIWKERVTKELESIEAQEEARKQFDEASKKGRSFIAAYKAYSEDLQADWETWRRIDAILDDLIEIAPKMAADLEKQTNEKRKQLQLRRMELETLESIYILERMRLAGRVYEAAGGVPLPTITMAQIRELQHLIALERGRPEELRDMRKVYEWQQEIFRLREKQIDADRQLREERINAIADEVEKEKQLAALAASDMQNRHQWYEDQRRIIWQMAMSREERLQALAELEERYNKRMALLEKERYDHAVKAQVIQYQNLRKQYEIQKTIAEARGVSAADLLMYDIAMARIEEQIARLNNDSLEAEAKRAEQLGLMADREREWQEQRIKWYNDWLSLRDQELDIAQKLFDMGLISERQLAAVRQRNALIALNNLNRLRQGTKEWNEEYLKYLDLIKQGQDETSDRFKNLIDQIIGAPQEAIQRFLSPAAIQQRFGQLAPAMAGLMGGIEAQLAGVRGKEIFIRVRVEGLETGQIDNRILKVVEPELRDFAHRLTNALGR